MYPEYNVSLLKVVLLTYLPTPARSSSMVSLV